MTEKEKKSQKEKDKRKKEREQREKYPVVPYISKEYYKNTNNLYIYVIIHPKFEGWIKLGRTINLANRLRSYQTNCPNREYSYVYTKFTSLENVCKIENYFKTNVYNNGWEWFKIDIKKAIETIEIIINLNAENEGNLVL